MSVEGIFRFLEQKWHTRWGLGVALVASTLLITFVVPDAVFRWRVIGIVAAWSAIAGGWLLGWRPRKARKGAVGLIISVACGESVESRLVCDEFVESFRELIRSGQTGSSFDVIIIPDHIAARVRDVEEAKALLKRTRGLFVLYGRVRPSHLKDKPAHFLKLDAIVSHSPLPQTLHQEFREEFAQLLPRRVLVGMGNDLVGFEFVSEWAHHVAKYILGMAATFSGNFDYAASLFEDLQQRIRSSHSEPAPLAHIRGQLPKRLAEVNTLRSAVAHRRWLKTKSDDDLASLSMYASRIPNQFVRQIGAMNIKAIWLFLTKRDAHRALAMLKRHRSPQDPAWLFNRAFLYAYIGNLTRARAAYRTLEGMVPNTDVLLQVEEFLYWMLKDEPQKIEVLYCLGLIAWKIRGDLVAAEKELSEFIAKCPPGRYVGERRNVAMWLAEIREEIGGFEPNESESGGPVANVIREYY